MEGQWGGLCVEMTAVLMRSWRFDLSVTLPCDDFEPKFVWFRFYFDCSALFDCITNFIEYLSSLQINTVCSI